MTKQSPESGRETPFSLKRVAQKVADLAVYYLFPRKTIVVVMSPMRSGSTLLKALLAQGGDVSHLPEIDYSNFPGNSFRFYRKAYFLSKERIIVLKAPDAVLKPLRPATPRIKAIVLVRDAEGVVRSLLKRHTQTQFAHRTASDWLSYWVKCYQRLIKSAAVQKIEVCGIRYEDLTSNPKALSAKLFAFIGSSREDGVDGYDRPKDFEWKWGSDDGSEKIRGLRVLPETRPADNLLDPEILAQHAAVQALQAAFGYSGRVADGTAAGHKEGVPWHWL